MNTQHFLAISLLVLTSLASAEPVKVNALNFARAETDVYFARLLQQSGGLSKFHHIREPAPIDKQDVIRMNRDTLYSSAIFDLDAGPVTLTLPDAGSRFMSLLIVNQDHYATDTLYAPAAKTFTRQSVGTRYFAALVRTFMNPADAGDVKAAHAAQDKVSIEQAGAGTFDVPDWDEATHKKTRDLLIELNAMGGTKDNRFGRKEDVDTISWLLGTATGWGGNPPKDAIYFPVYPAVNDGKTAYTLTVKEVPVDGFWSITVYDEQGFMFENAQRAYSINNVTARRAADGSIRIQFGGDPSAAENFLAIKPGWNYLARLYRPRTEVIEGTWKFPQAQPAK